MHVGKKEKKGSNSSSSYILVSRSLKIPQIQEGCGFVKKRGIIYLQEMEKLY